MEYIEWKDCKKNLDSKSSLCPGYILSDGSRFIMEPGFYGQLQNFKNVFPERYDEVIKAINERVKKNKKVFFTTEVEAPYVELKDYIYLEITDILDSLKILVEDKSRGSDYGD